MTGHGSAQADFSGDLVAHFTHQDDVRILTQAGAQDALEGQVDLVVDLHLIDARQAVFDRIFDGDDFLLRRIELGQRSVERGGFTRAGGAGDQHHAAGAMNGMTQAFEHQRRHAHAIQPQQAGALRQETHHRRLAILRRQGGQTHIDGGVLQLHVEAAVLRQALFGNVQAGHQLETQDQRCADLGIGLGLHVQHAIDAEADHQLFFTRLDVDVGGTRLDRFLEHRIQQLHHRRIVGGVGQAQHGLEIAATEHRHVGGQLLRQPGDFFGVPIMTVEHQHQLAFHHHRQRDLAPQHTGDFVKSREIGRIGKPDQQHVLLLIVIQHQGAVATRRRLGQQVDELGLELIVHQIDEGGLQLAPQRPGDMRFGNKTGIDEDAPQLAPGQLLFFQRQLELFVSQ